MRWCHTVQATIALLAYSFPLYASQVKEYCTVFALTRQAS